MRLRALRAVLLAIVAATCALAAQAAKPYLILVSLDGFRYDYVERYHAANIAAIAKEGAWAPQGMIPSFPSVTFPNHISLVTGLYPEHHGIVLNSFYDPARKERYNMSQSATDGSWYRVKPIWVLAEEQGVKSGCMFWPTADAEILGVRPTYYKKYDGSFRDEDRVKQVIEWLKLPEAQRPHFLTLYFSDVDSAGHSFSPESPETERAVQKVDKLIGDLRAGLKPLGLPVDLIVVADHGMQTVEKSVRLNDFADLSKVQAVTDGPVVLLYAPDAATAETTYLALKGKSPDYEVYRRKETPPGWHYTDDPRIGDLVVIATGPYSISVQAQGDGRRGGRGRGGDTAAPARGGRDTSAPGRGTDAADTRRRGTHGYDPARFHSMYALFCAVGPNIKTGVQLKPFENVDVFPLMTHILGLKNPAKLDGTEKPIRGIYRPSRMAAAH